MSQYYRTLIQDGFLLDTFPNAAVAYSLRKLRDGYTGSAIRVRRSSDNTEQDIGFTSTGNLDTTSMVNFVGWNLFAWSEQLQQTYWAKTNLTVTTDALVAPDGNTTGDILYETTTNAAHTLSRSLSVSAGQEYTLSFWVQAQGRTFVRLNSAINLSWDGVTNPIAWLNLSTGTIVSQNAGYGGTVQISSAPNGWYFVSFRVKAINPATSTILVLSLSPDGTTTSYAGNTSLGVAVWGLQVSETDTIRAYRKTDALAEGSGFVTTWYDQSGNNRNATQTTVANQCQIVSGGNLILTISNKVTTLWTNDRYGFTFFTLNANLLVSSVFVGTRTTGNIIGLGSSNNLQAESVKWLSTNELTSFGTSNNGSSTYTGNFVMFTQRLGDSSVNLWLNNVQGNTGTSISNSGPNSLGSSNNLTFNNGNFQELILWNGNTQIGFESQIQNNINQFYGIY